MSPKISIFTTLCSLVLFTSPVSANTVTLAELSPKQVGTLRFVTEVFAEQPALIKVAFCESSLEHTEEDGSVKRGDVDSRDTGLMQINKGYHAKKAKELGLNLENQEDNAKYAIWLFENQGLQPWSSSKPCWKNLKLPKLEYADNVESKGKNNKVSNPR